MDANTLPKPFYSDDRCTIYHGDCRDLLPLLGRFDLLLTDPPYGIGHKWDKPGRFSGAAGKLWNGDAGWDSEAPSEQVISAARSAAEMSIIWGRNYFVLPPSRGYLVWDKMQSNFSLADSELAWVSKPITQKTFRMSRGELASEGKVHPTQKPVPLMQWCIGIAGDEVKTILDPYCGSGTSLVAAKLEGRHAVGIEINERYCELAAERLRQGVLF